MQKAYPKTALFTTSAKNTVVVGGGSNPTINILGLNPMRISDIANIGIKKSRAAVGQVYTIGGDTPTLTVGNIYKIAMKRQVAKSQSNFEDYNKVFKVTLDSDKGSAVLNRTHVYAQLASQINLDTSVNITAVATAGTSLVLTEDPTKYFSGVHNAATSGRGANEIKVTRDANGGFADSSLVQTTAPVYAAGQGADLLKMGAGQGVYGHLVSEAIEGKEALSGASTGQTYNSFVFTSIVPHNSGHGGVAAWNVVTQELYVDNGEGDSATNLAGYRAFELEIERIIYGEIWGSAPGTIGAIFKGATAPSRLGEAGGLPTGSAGDENVYHFADQGVSLMQSILGTQTDLYSQLEADGLRLTQDAADNDGMEFHPQYHASSPYIVTVQSGTYSVRAQIKVGDVSDADEIMIGFRSAVAVQANVTGYDDIIALNIDLGDVQMITEDANSGTRAVTDSLINVADAGVVDLEVRLNNDGTTEFLINDVDYSNLITTPVTHTAGQTLIPFMRCLNAAAGDPEADVAKFFFVNDILARD